MSLHPGDEFAVGGHVHLLQPCKHGKEALHGDEMRICQTGGHKGRALFTSPGMDDVGLDLPQSAPDQKRVEPKQGGAPCAAAVFQKMKSDAISLEGEVAVNVLSQDNDVDAEQWILLKFSQQHRFPRCRMPAGKAAERLWKIGKPLDWKIGYPGDS